MCITNTQICSNLKETSKKSEQEKLVHLLRELLAHTSKKSATKVSDYTILFDYQESKCILAVCVRTCMRACVCVTVQPWHRCLVYTHLLHTETYMHTHTHAKAHAHAHAHRHDIQHT